ncbi:hypothetical protein GQ44DRAFT_710613 [Phaeosphaeriaceae sp. PMI808]|nr:hypothetical protein GQ44DRAFT_710613 [Phaeosphaeriaceae sp. PMI808]
MDETGVMLSMLGSVKALIGRDDIRGYRGAGVKRTMVTAIECIDLVLGCSGRVSGLITVALDVLKR